MGTRNLTCVYLDADYKVAQYGQWDGYPEGAGASILTFLRSMNKEMFANKVRNNTRFISSEEFENCWKSVGAVNEWVSPKISDEFKHQFPSLHRDTGYYILDIINKSNDTIPLNNNIEFIEDGLFCEWTYVVDIDRNTFEVYKGAYDGNSESTRFDHFKGQCILAGKWSLDDLPTVDQFKMHFVEVREVA